MRKLWILIPPLLFLFPVFGLQWKNKYDFSTTAMTWKDAQAFCREHYTDLVTVRNEQENSFAYGWIGLHRKNATSPWKWSRGDEMAYFTMWEANEPKPYGDCVREFNGKWRTNNCDDRLYFRCYFEPLVLVKENKTWEEALDHCRSMDAVETDDPASSYWNHRYDLVTLISPDDHTFAQERAQEANTDEVWTGLHYLAGEWLWVGGEEMQYADIPRCPIESFCGVLEKNGAASFGIRNCQLKRNFLCYKKP